MGEVIRKITKILNLVKDFEAGYTTKTMKDGYMLIQHKDKKYAVKLVEITNPAEDIFDDIESTKYYFEEWFKC